MVIRMVIAKVRLFASQRGSSRPEYGLRTRFSDGCPSTLGSSFAITRLSTKKGHATCFFCSSKQMEKCPRNWLGGFVHLNRWIFSLIDSLLYAFNISQQRSQRETTGTTTRGGEKNEQREGRLAATIDTTGTSACRGENAASFANPRFVSPLMQPARTNPRSTTTARRGWTRRGSPASAGRKR
jgi:hypothetical protein